MPHFSHLLIGGGIAADSAAKTIRQLRPSDSIGIVASEPHPPYNRPPLSKALWKGDPEESIWRETPRDGVTLHLGRTAVALDTRAKTVTDDQGQQYSYGKLLLATGGKVRKLPGAPEGVIYYRTLDDYRALRAATGQGGRLAVIGGGFIGSEVAAALAMNGKPATMIFPEDAIGARIYPGKLAQFLNSWFREKGVEVLERDGVAAIERVGNGYRVRTKSGKMIEAAAVVAGIGIEPDVDLARGAGIAVDNGITVDEWLKSSAPDVYAAGDVANFYSRALGTRRRVEHEDNSNVMGETAGSNMAGEPRAYDYIPFFYSDLFDLGYEAVGETDSRLEIVEDWKESNREGVVYYLKEGRVRGVLLWNTWGQVDNARALIGEPGPFDAGNLKGRLPK